MSVFLDTNVLLYSIGVNPKEATKTAIAAELLERTDCVLSVQVLQEFYAQSTRPTRPGPISSDLAVEFILAWRRFAIVENTMQILMSAMDIAQAAKLSLRDSLILSAALSARCEVLYSEDLNHGQKLGGLTIMNPFRA